MNLESFRLVLDEHIQCRPFTLEDAVQLHTAIHTSFECLSEWLPDIARIVEVEDAHQWLARRIDAMAERTSVYCGIWRAEQVVGCIGFHNYSDSVRQISLGCWLIEGEQGVGLMFRIAESFIERCLDTLNVDAISWDCEVANERSARLAERLGFTLQERRLVPSRFDADVAVEQAFYSLSAGHRQRAVPGFRPWTLR